MPTPAFERSTRATSGDTTHVQPLDGMDHEGGDGGDVLVLSQSSPSHAEADAATVPGAVGQQQRPQGGTQQQGSGTVKHPAQGDLDHGIPQVEEHGSSDGESAADGEIEPVAAISDFAARKRDILGAGRSSSAQPALQSGNLRRTTSAVPRHPNDVFADGHTQSEARLRRITSTVIKEASTDPVEVHAQALRRLYLERIPKNVGKHDFSRLVRKHGSMVWNRLAKKYPQWVGQYAQGLPDLPGETEQDSAYWRSMVSGTAAAQATAPPPKRSGGRLGSESGLDNAAAAEAGAGGEPEERRPGVTVKAGAGGEAQATGTASLAAGSDAAALNAKPWGRKKSWLQRLFSFRSD